MKTVAEMQAIAEITLSLDSKPALLPEENRIVVNICQSNVLVFNSFRIQALRIRCNLSMVNEAVKSIENFVSNKISLENSKCWNVLDHY